jgi:hypothetical protein
MKRVFLFFLTIVVVVSFSSYSQTSEQREQTAKSQIELLLANYKNGPYKEITELVDVDSSIGAKGISNGNISDPYGTLKGCYLFMATTKGGKWGDDQRHSIGIFKDSLIIWMSDQLPGSENYGYITDEGILATKDLNKMGMVDIVVYFSDGMNPPSSYYLWIFSWDGKNGKCINKCEKNGETSIASTGSFKVVDADGDGICEIRPYNKDSEINAIYYWNGDIYKKKSDVLILK